MVPYIQDKTLAKKQDLPVAEAVFAAAAAAAVVVVRDLAVVHDVWDAYVDNRDRLQYTTDRKNDHIELQLDQP